MKESNTKQVYLNEESSAFTYSKIEIDSRISKEKENSRIKYPSIDQDCWIDNAPKTVKGERDNNGIFERVHEYTPICSLHTAINVQDAANRSSKRNRNLLLDDSSNSIERDKLILDTRIDKIQMNSFASKTCENTEFKDLNKPQSIMECISQIGNYNKEK